MGLGCRARARGRTRCCSPRALQPSHLYTGHTGGLRQVAVCSRDCTARPHSCCWPDLYTSLKVSTAGLLCTASRQASSAGRPGRLGTGDKRGTGGRTRGRLQPWVALCKARAQGAPERPRAAQCTTPPFDGLGRGRLQVRRREEKAAGGCDDDATERSSQGDSAEKARAAGLG